MLTSRLMPTLYTSSFDADAALREPPPRTADKVIVGFREQTAAVAAVGITALLERVAVEGTSTVIEGAHVVPGFYDAAPYADRILAVPVVVTVEDEEAHRSHFVARADSPRPVRALPGLVREHPEGAALHQEPGAVARGSGRPELRTGPDDRRDHRSGDGPRLRAAGRPIGAAPEPAPMQRVQEVEGANR